MNLEGKIITVVGLARSGQAAAKLAFQVGATVRVTDMARIENIDQPFLKWISLNNITAEFGGHSQSIVEGADLIVVSPGVKIDSPVLQWARGKKIPVVGELEFAYQFCPCPILAVTGSNGKTTVTTLIGRVLEAAGKNIFVGGNIGKPLSDYVLELTPDDIAVLEVSSFQLETIEQFHPHIAVFLNISQNHLDRHPDMEEYGRMKMRIFENQTNKDIAVLNAQDDYLIAMANKLPSKISWFNDGQDHGNPNFSAAKVAVASFGIDQDVIDRVFNEFQGINHRLELVRDIHGIKFINDSKSTTTEASRWALEQLREPIVWICGGRDKNLDFSVLREMVKMKVRKIFAIGEAADKVRHSFEDIVEVECFNDLKTAVIKSAEFAAPGEVVLLSPMCASFDMFMNFEHRGEIFKEIVESL